MGVGDDAPRFDNAAGDLAKLADILGEQRPLVFDLADENGLFFGLWQREVIRRNAIGGEDSCQRLGVQARVLANIQRGQVQPEQANLADDAAQLAFSDAAALVLAQHFLHQAQVVQQRDAALVLVGGQLLADARQDFAVALIAAGGRERLAELFHVH